MSYETMTLPGLDTPVSPFASPPRLARIRRVDAILAADGAIDDDVGVWVSEVAARLDIPATLASVAATLWGSVPGCDEALYFLCEVCTQVAGHEIDIVSPWAQRVARAHDLVACPEAPSLPACPDTATYLRRAFDGLGFSADPAASLSTAQTVAAAVDEFVTAAIG